MTVMRPLSPTTFYLSQINSPNRFTNSKFNTGWSGGAVKNSGAAAAGGVLRNETGVWVAGFVLNIGCCSVVEAELWGLAKGLEVAWDKGVKKVICETDSKRALELLSKQIKTTHPCASLVNVCHGFIRRNWDLQLRHIFREANGLADCLASSAFSFSLGTTVLNLCPAGLSNRVKEDAKGVPTLRWQTT